MACLGEVRFVFSIGESPSPPNKNSIPNGMLFLFAKKDLNSSGERRDGWRPKNTREAKYDWSGGTYVKNAKETSALYGTKSICCGWRLLDTPRAQAFAMCDWSGGEYVKTVKETSALYGTQLIWYGWRRVHVLLSFSAIRMHNSYGKNHSEFASGS